MQKKILVAVDGSPSSRQAVDYAGRQIETRTDWRCRWGITL
jgi:nucleotide-binding universal stress UspA family protein